MRLKWPQNAVSHQRSVLFTDNLLKMRKLSQTHFRRFHIWTAPTKCHVTRLSRSNKIRYKKLLIRILRHLLQKWKHYCKCIGQLQQKKAFHSFDILFCTQDNLYLVWANKMCQVNPTQGFRFYWKCTESTVYLNQQWRNGNTLFKNPNRPPTSWYSQKQWHS